MSTYLLIVLIVGLALAPLLHFLPGKRQRQLARMREYAAVHGLFVEFRDTPGEDMIPGGARGRFIYYGKRLPPAAADRVTTARWARVAGEWRSVGRRVPVPDILKEMPPEVIAASVDPASCGIHWDESSGEAGVELLRVLLERWSGEYGQA